MLSHCRAYLIAPSVAECRTLASLAARSGFRVVHSAFDTAAEDPELPVTYFFLHYHLSDAAMQQVIAQVRGLPDPGQRLSPVILIIDDCTVEVLLKYIDFGFDDVISLPEKREVLEARLAAQLNAEQVYYQTPDYLGPDRRRMELPHHTDQRRANLSPHMRMVIRRDPVRGTSVLQRQLVGQALKRPPEYFGGQSGTRFAG
jgi:hypothetical protein